MYLVVILVEMTGTAPVSLEVTLDVYYHRFFWVLWNLNRIKNIPEDTIEYTAQFPSEDTRGSEMRDLWVQEMHKIDAFSGL